MFLGKNVKFLGKLILGKIYFIDTRETMGMKGAKDWWKVVGILNESQGTIQHKIPLQKAFKHPRNRKFTKLKTFNLLSSLLNTPAPKETPPSSLCAQKIHLYHTVAHLYFHLCIVNLSKLLRRLREMQFQLLLSKLNLFLIFTILWTILKGRFLKWF